MKRIARNRPLTPLEAAKYEAIRKQVAEELPDLIARHHERMASLDQLQKLLKQLKAAREAKGLSLADLTDLTGMDRSALSKLEALIPKLNDKVADTLLGYMQQLREKK